MGKGVVCYKTLHQVYVCITIHNTTLFYSRMEMEWSSWLPTPPRMNPSYLPGKWRFIEIDRIYYCWVWSSSQRVPRRSHHVWMWSGWTWKWARFPSNSILIFSLFQASNNKDAWRGNHWLLGAHWLNEQPLSLPGNKELSKFYQINCVSCHTWQCGWGPEVVVHIKDIGQKWFWRPLLQV